MEPLKSDPTHVLSAFRSYQEQNQKNNNKTKSKLLPYPDAVILLPLALSTSRGPSNRHHTPFHTWPLLQQTSADLHTFSPPCSPPPPPLTVWQNSLCCFLNMHGDYQPVYNFHKKRDFSVLLITSSLPFGRRLVHAWCSLQNKDIEVSRLGRQFRKRERSTRWSRTTPHCTL